MQTISAWRSNKLLRHISFKIYFENWKKILDQKKTVGAVCMDLSKTFVSLPHDLLIAKMHAYDHGYWLVQNRWNDCKPDKFKAIVVHKNCRMKDSYALIINNQTINSENCVKLLGIERDNALSLDQRVFIFYSLQKSNQSIKWDRRNSEIHRF